VIFLRVIHARSSLHNTTEIVLPLPIEESIHLRGVAETVTLAKLKLGEIINALPKNSGGDRKSEDFKIKNDTPVDFEKPKPKAETIAELGISKTRRAD